MGTWGDGNWGNPSGTPGAPSAIDNAFIGSTAGTGWVGNATVNVSANAQANVVSLGDGLSTGFLTIDAGSTLTAGHLVSNSGSSLTVNGSLAVSTSLELYGSSTQINGNTTVGGTIYTYGGSLTQSANIDANELILGWSGVPTSYIRTSGQLTLDNLTVDSGSAITFLPGDSIANSVSVYNGSTFQSNSPISLASLLVSNSTLELANSISASGYIYLDSATMNRSVGATLSTPDLVLTGMAFDLDGTDTITNYVQLDSSTLNISVPTTLPGGIYAQNTATVNINSSTTLGSLQLYDSTLNLNANLDLGTGVLYTGGGAINQNGNISGNLEIGWGGVATAFNRNVGNLNVTNLSLHNGSTVALTASDKIDTVFLYGGSNLTIPTAGIVTTSASANSGSTLTINSPLSLTNYVSVDNSILNLNGGITTGSYVELNSATFNRASGATISTPALYLTNMTYNLDGTDTITNYVQLDSSTLNISVPTTLPGGIYAQNIATVNINSSTTLGSLQIYDSTLNLNANLDLGAGVLYTGGGVVNQNGNISGNLEIGWSGTTTAFNRTAGVLDVASLSLHVNSALALSSTDSVDNLQLYGTSTLTFSQATGETTGLDLLTLQIDPAAKLEILFDGVNGSGLDWGLRLAGDQQLLLTGFLSGGQLATNLLSAGVIYDTANFGDYTYYGSVSAVPEPSSAMLLLISGITMPAYRRRRPQQDSYTYDFPVA